MYIRGSRRREILSKFEELPTVTSFVAVRSFTPAIVAGESDNGQFSKQKLGTTGWVNLNGEEVANGALDEWLAEADRIPMYAGHNTGTVPGGTWSNFELRGSELYAQPSITETTSVGRDIAASLEAGDADGISWTVYPTDWDAIQFRARREGENQGWWGDEVMVVTKGSVSEASLVYAPADPSAHFKASAQYKESIMAETETVTLRVAEADLVAETTDQEGVLAITVPVASIEDAVTFELEE